MLRKKKDNRGVTLIELIVVIAIMAVLGVVVALSVTHFVEKARRAQVESEAGQFAKAAEIAYIEAVASGNTPSSDAVKNVVADKNNKYYKNGTKYGRLTNWSYDGGALTTSNKYFNDQVFAMLKITTKSNGDATWKSGNSVVPMYGSDNTPIGNQKASMTDKSKFQVFYDSYGNLVTEYSRQGYFIRLEGSVMVYSEKAKENTIYFTKIPN